MSLVATLICNPADPALDSTVVDCARAILPAAGAAHWLFDEVAVDIPFESSEDIRAIDKRLREARGDLPIDIVVQSQAFRRKKLFLADMDSTMIGQECIDELADYAGLKAHVAAITERAMRGAIEFEPALRERVALLRGLAVGVVDEVLKQRITPTPGGRELVMTMRAHGAYTCLISGGFTLFTNAVAAMIGFQENRANELKVEDGKLSGQVAEPILGRAAKLATLIELRESFDLDEIDTLVTGDGANDLGMIAAAGLGVAYHAKPAVAAAAAARIDHGDLTALLYIQGYRRDEVVEGEGVQIDAGGIRPVSVAFTADELVVTLADGRKIATPLTWYPRLRDASAAARGRFELMPMGIHWPELDEDLGIAGMLRGRPGT